VPMRILVTIAALLTAACAATGSIPTASMQSEAQRCAEGGGIWRVATESCEQSSGGGGY
jgi:hypothetical protein